MLQEAKWFYGKPSWICNNIQYVCKWFLFLSHWASKKISTKANLATVSVQL